MEQKGISCCLWMTWNCLPKVKTWHRLPGTDWAYIQRGHLYVIWNERMEIKIKNKIISFNTWVISVMRHGSGILKWNTYEFKSLDRRTRKFMTMHGVLHAKLMLIGFILVRKWEEGSPCYKDGIKQLGMVCQEFSWAIDCVKAAETTEYNDTVNKKEFKQSWMRVKWNNISYCDPAWKGVQ